MWCDDLRIAIQSHGICLAKKDATKSPRIGGFVVVHEEVGYQNHCLNRLDGSPRKEEVESE